MATKGGEANPRKRGRIPELEAKLATWARRHARNEGARATSMEIRARANELADEMGIEESKRPKFSHGWVHGFKTRFQLIEKPVYPTKKELLARLQGIGASKDLLDFVANYDDTTKPPKIFLTHEQKYEVCAHNALHTYHHVSAIVAWAKEYFALPAEMSTSTMYNILDRADDWKAKLTKETVKDIEKRQRKYVDGKCNCKKYGRAALQCFNSGQLKSG